MKVSRPSNAQLGRPGGGDRLRDDHSVRLPNALAAEATTRLSALYSSPQREDIIGSVRTNEWVADILTQGGSSTSGPRTQTHKTSIQKHWRDAPDHARKRRARPVLHSPVFLLCAARHRAALAFVGAPTASPACQRDDSVVHNPLGVGAAHPLRPRETRAGRPHRGVLSGRGHTSSMLGNGRLQEILPGLVTVDRSHRSIRSCEAIWRGVGLTKISIPHGRMEGRGARRRRRVTDVSVVLGLCPRRPTCASMRRVDCGSWRSTASRGSSP